jgi:hypothetical protein
MALNNLGDVPAGTVLPLFWTSHDAATGANETMSGLATTDIEVYKGTSMTQRSSDAGYALIDTDGIDIDTTTGLNGISIDLDDNTDAGFYAAGSYYNVVVGPVTIDAQTVTIHLATFRIVAAEATAGTPETNTKTWNGLTTVALPLVPTTAGRTLDVSAGGEAGLDWANIGSPTTAQNLSATNIDVDQVVASVSGAVASVTGAVGSVTTVSDKTGYAIGVGGIASTAFAAGAIDAAAIAADAIGASELAQDAAQEVADEVLNRNLAGGGSGNTRNVRNALRSLRNKVAISGGTATVYAENDTDAAWTAAVTTAAGDPISEVDPA